MGETRLSFWPVEFESIEISRMKLLNGLIWKLEE